MSNNRRKDQEAPEHSSVLPTGCDPWTSHCILWGRSWKTEVHKGQVYPWQIREGVVEPIL